MQASSTQGRADHRLAVTALVAASTFVFGAVLGGAASLAAAPLVVTIAAPAAVDSWAIDLSAPALRLHRDGEINPDAAAFDREDKGLRLQREGEISAGTAPADGALRAQRGIDEYRGK